MEQVVIGKWLSVSVAVVDEHGVLGSVQTSKREISIEFSLLLPTFYTHTHTHTHTHRDYTCISDYLCLSLSP